MTRTPLKHRELPSYTKGEEIFNMVSHIAGGALGVIMLVLCVVKAALGGDVWSVVGSSVYGVTLVVMFTVSSVYHGLRPSMGKQVMRVIDHCDIYFLIAGTYTPILLTAVRPEHPVVAWSVFAVEWGLTALAATLNAIDLKKYTVLSMICYIGLGWCVVFVLGPTIEAVGWGGFWYLLAGGIAYTVGAVLYGLGKKLRYMHSVFHLFVVLGAVLQFFAIYFYVL